MAKILIVDDNEENQMLLNLYLSRAGALVQEASNGAMGVDKALAGDYDLVCCGHSHETEIRQQPNIKGSTTWLVNPGTVAGLGAPTATWVLGDLDALSFEIRELPRASAT